MVITSKLMAFPMNVLRRLWLTVHTYYQLHFYTSPVGSIDPYGASKPVHVDESQKYLVADVFSKIKHLPLYNTLKSEAPYAKRVNIPSLHSAKHRGIIRLLPKVMNAPFETVETRYANRMSYTVWVLWMNDRSVEVVVPKQNIGRLLSGSELIHVNDPADKMPDGVMRAARIIIGTELVDNSLRGCRWEFYVHPNSADV